MAWLENIFGKWVVKKRWWIIVATGIAVAVAASGVRFLTFNKDMRVFFSDENPQLKALEAVEDTYTKNESVFFAVAVKHGDVFTREALAAIEEITENGWKMPYSSRVDSITNFQHTKVEGDDLIVENLVEDAQGLTDADLERVKKIALSEPQLVRNLISSSGQVAGININILFPGKTLDEGRAVTDFSRQLKQAMQEKYPSLDIHLTGNVIFDYVMSEVSENDMATLIPVMLLVLLAIIGFALRSVIGTLATAVVILISMATGMGLAGWLGIEITPASANAPIIILTLAVADSIHILATIFNLFKAGKSKDEAIAESMRINLQPVFLTSLTTAIGFLAMNFSEVPPFRDLGNIVAMGVLVAFVYSVFFLPAFVAVLPLKLKVRPDKKVCPGCDKFANFIITRYEKVFWSTLAIVLVLTAGIFRIEFNDTWIQYFHPRYDVRKSTDFLEKNLSGFDRIEYSLESGEAGGINDPRYLQTLEEFAGWYRGQPNVVHINIITDTMKRLNRDMHAGDPSFYRIPESRDLAAQYLLLYEMSLPFGLDLNNQIDLDKSATRMIVTLRSTKTTQLRAIDARARAWLKENAPQEMFTYGTGLSVIWAHISERNINSLIGASLGALLLISLFMILALRSIKIGLLSLLPNLTPALMAFGIWGFLVGQVGLGLSVVVSLTIGIVVDDTVHFLSKYLRARREHNMNAKDAVQFSFNMVGTAMWITSVALVAGFSIFTFSGFKMNSDMGQLTAITITMALAMDFLFLPTLLIKVEGKDDERTDNKEKADFDRIGVGRAAVPLEGIGRDA